MARAALPAAIKPHRILWGPLRGQQIVTSWAAYPRAILGRVEPELLKWLRVNQRPGETWLDIGACYGYTALAMARGVGPTGRVVAFEPVLATAAALERTAAVNALPYMTVAPYLLSDIGALSLAGIPIAASGMADVTIADGTPPTLVAAASLEWLWPFLAGEDQRIDGIKIDVQGMEVAVLRGMAGLLATQRPKVVVEIHRGVRHDEIRAIMNAAGYNFPAQAIDAQDGDDGRQDYNYAFVPE